MKTLQFDLRKEADELANLIAGLQRHGAVFQVTQDGMYATVHFQSK